MSMFTYTQKTNEVYADTENACYSEEMLNLMFYGFFGQGGGHYLEIKIMTLITFIMVD